MRSLLIILAATLCLCSCQQTKPVERSSATMKTYPEKLAASTIYEVNIRQHTKEGTIKAFIKDLPRLKELGIGMLWIMPIQPIGQKNRKLPLGSYYSVQAYDKVNPEFGTEEDFANLVAKTHELGMQIILDWVPNHTAWDHPWITEHPEYYAHDSKGNIVHESDWDDIALLDHTNPGTRASMIREMKYWVTKYDIDGFRCDHAGHEIPLYFWEEATQAIDSIKDVFWLAEWDGARMHLTFDGTYAWALLKVTDNVGKGTATANDIADWIEKDSKEYGRKPLRMTMITNHDENAWNGTEFERYGEGAKTFATFIFSAYGIPMLYSGQEVGLNRRLLFFAKDSVDWSDPLRLQPFYKQLVSLHSDNKALWCGEYGGATVRINDADPAVFAFKRVKDDNRVIGVMNFSDKPQTLKLKDGSVAGTYQDYFTGETKTLSLDTPLPLLPWQYLIFVGDSKK